MQLDLPITGGLIVLVAALAALFGFMGARPVDITKGPRMIPWRFLMLLCATIVIVLLVHLLTVLGLKQDAPQY
jgi:hypothetical protein